MNIAVLGAGVSGLSVSKMLKDTGHSVDVYEKDHQIGGLAKSRYTNGLLYDPHGGHIFNSKNSQVMEWAFSLMPKDKWVFSQRNAKIYIDGRFVSYPFELSLCELDIGDAVDCAYDYICSQQGPEPENYRDWLIWNFGQSICDLYMIPYNEKIWSYPLELMGTKWIRGKMPLPTKKELIQSILLKDPSERKMPHSSFYYPIDGGIQSFINAIAEDLNVYCDCAISSIKKKDNKWIINESNEYDYVISTIPLPVLGNVLDGIPTDVKKSIEGLKYNSLTTVLFECLPTDISWLYVPSHEFLSHRVGYQSTLTPHATYDKNVGAAALEIIGPRFDVEQLDKEKNVLPECLGYSKTVDCEFSEYAYVVNDIFTDKNINCIMNYFESVSQFELLGRWGEWKYYNMDVCIARAMELVDKMNRGI